MYKQIYNGIYLLLSALNNQHKVQDAFRKNKSTVIKTYQTASWTEKKLRGPSGRAKNSRQSQQEQIKKKRIHSAVRFAEITPV